jgi:hypothetical protein
VNLPLPIIMRLGYLTAEKDLLLERVKFLEGQLENQGSTGTGEVSAGGLAPQGGRPYPDAGRPAPENMVVEAPVPLD